MLNAWKWLTQNIEASAITCWPKFASEGSGIEDTVNISDHQCIVVFSWLPRHISSRVCDPRQSVHNDGSISYPIGIGVGVVVASDIDITAFDDKDSTGFYVHSET